MRYMQLKQLQSKVAKKILKNAQRDKIKITADYLFLKLTEEIGEMFQSYLIYKRQCRPVKYLAPFAAKRVLAKEMADVLSLLITTAQNLRIDLGAALDKKLFSQALKK